MSDSRERAEMQALDWQMRLHQSPRNPLLRLRHRHWLAEHPLHKESWDAVHAMWQLTGELQPATRRHWPGKGLRTRPLAMASAACVLLAVFVTWLALPSHTPGEALSSADGSRIWSTAETRLERHIDTDRRQVILHKGAAFFEVAPDSSRPFTVTASGIEVRVVGTAFAVELQDNRVQVAVEHGRVRVGSGSHWQELGPGQMLTVDPQHLQEARPADIIGPIAPWRDNLLVARNETIDSLVTKVAAAHTGFVWLRDSTLGQQRVTGLYDLNQPEQALASMVRPHGGQVRHVWPNLLLIDTKKH